MVIFIFLIAPQKWNNIEMHFRASYHTLEPLLHRRLLRAAGLRSCQTISHRMATLEAPASSWLALFWPMELVVGTRPNRRHLRRIAFLW